MRMDKPFVDRLEKRVVGVIGELKGFFEISGGDGVEALLGGLGASATPEDPPPEGAFEDDGEGGEKGQDNRPHDGAAFVEVIDDDVCERGVHGMTPYC